MKSYLAIPLLFAALTFGAASASAQTLKVGTVDMKRVFESYYKTKDAESRINEARNAAKKELDDRMDVYNKSVAEVQKINSEIDKPELSKEAKEQKSKSRDEKIGELKSMEKEINEFRTTREKQLQDQSVRMRAGIVDDINKVVDEKVKAEGFQLVLDKSGPSLNGVPLVLYSRDEWEFTNDVISALNKNKGADAGASAPAAKPAAAPAAPAKKK